MNSLNTSWFNSSLAFYILSHTLSLHYSCCHQMNFFFINGKVAPHRSEDKSKQNCPTLGLVIGIFWTTIFYICQNFIITRCLITSVCWWRVNQTLMGFFFLFAFMKDLVSKTVSNCPFLAWRVLSVFVTDHQRLYCTDFVCGSVMSYLYGVVYLVIFVIHRLYIEMC